MAWNLERPKAALSASYFWTWDHSCNWVLDDPGALNFGCYNRYLKRPETFVEDYRRLTDLVAGLGIGGIVVWGFLRDSHGGIDAARRVAEYAASRGVTIMPGVGLTWYGGPYYEGEHPYNLETFLCKYPEARMVPKRTMGAQPGMPGGVGACPLHPAFRQWMAAGLRWLFDTFPIGGVNLENGDFAECQCPRCAEHRALWTPEDPEFFRMQSVTYGPAAEALAPYLREKLITWATYTSFSFGLPARHPSSDWPSIGQRVPSIMRTIDPASVAQFTLTQVVHEPALPLAAYLDDGAPAAAFDNAYWPADLRPPIARSTGFLHQGSQWMANGPSGRYGLVLSSIKEGCLRAGRSGMEGVSIHGEVTSRYVPWALNYLAFSHFVHWPEDTLRDFARKTLAPVMGGEDEARRFVELLAKWDGESLTDDDRKQSRQGMRKHHAAVARGERSALDPAAFWHWLDRMVHGIAERDTASFY